MAFSLKIEVELKLPKKRKITIEPKWWDIDDLLKKYKFREKSDGVYRDHFLEINFTTFRKIHLSQMKYFKNELYGAPDWQKVLKPMLRQIDKIIANGKAFEKATVIIYEWESGMN